MIGITLLIVFLNDFIIMAFLWPSQISNTMVSGSTYFYIAIILILISLKPLLINLKNSKLILTILYLVLGSALVIFGFMISEDIFLGAESWGFSTFTNIMAEILILIGTVTILNGFLILSKGNKIAKLLIGIISMILGVIVIILGVFYLLPFIPLAYTFIAVIITGMMQGYFIFGILLFILGIVIIIKRKK